MITVNAETPPNGPLSWRDVYRAVGESEARVIAEVAQLRAVTLLTLTDHEGRLRILAMSEAKRSAAFSTGKVLTLGLFSLVGTVTGVLALLAK
jgi:hypothetical protein